MRLQMNLAKIGVGFGLIAGSIMAANAAPINFCTDEYTTLELNKCTAKSLHYENKKLNSSYKSLMKLLDSEDKSQLKKAQLSWIDFRDDSCDFKSRWLKGGSMYTMDYTICLTNYTYQRRLELDHEIELLSDRL